MENRKKPKNPELSIIIPTLNEEKYLPKLLRSIKNQDFKNLEIIIADSNSTDGTRKIAREYGCVITGGGRPAHGRNLGAKESRGDIFLFLDCDALIPGKDYLTRALEEFKRKNLDVACALQKPRPTGKVINDAFYGFIFGSINLGMLVAQKTRKPFMQCCMFAKRQAHKDIGGFDETVIYAEDSYYAREAVKKGGRFGILTTDYVGISPRRYENGGAKLFWQNIYFLMGLLVGYKFKNGGKMKYHEHHDKITA